MGPGDECMGQLRHWWMVDGEDGGPVVWEGKETHRWQHQRGKWKTRRPFIRKGCSYFGSLSAGARMSEEILKQTICKLHKFQIWLWSKISLASLSSPSLLPTAGQSQFPQTLGKQRPLGLDPIFILSLSKPKAVSEVSLGYACWDSWTKCHSPLSTPSSWWGQFLRAVPDEVVLMFRDICLKFTKYSSPLYYLPTNTQPLSNNNKSTQHNLEISFPDGKIIFF